MDARANRSSPSPQRNFCANLCSPPVFALAVDVGQNRRALLLFDELVKELSRNRLRHPQHIHCGRVRESNHSPGIEGDDSLCRHGDNLLALFIRVESAKTALARPEHQPNDQKAPDQIIEVMILQRESKTERSRDQKIQSDEKCCSRKNALHHPYPLVSRHSALMLDFGVNQVR